MQSEYCISPFVIIYFLVTIAITTVTFTLTIDKDGDAEKLPAFLFIINYLWMQSLKITR